MLLYIRRYFTSTQGVMIMSQLSVWYLAALHKVYWSGENPLLCGVDLDQIAEPFICDYLLYYFKFPPNFPSYNSHIYGTDIHMCVYIFLRLDWLLGKMKKIKNLCLWCYFGFCCHTYISKLALNLTCNIFMKCKLYSTADCTGHSGMGSCPQWPWRKCMCKEKKWKWKNNPQRTCCVFSFMCAAVLLTIEKISYVCKPMWHLQNPQCTQPNRMSYNWKETFQMGICLNLKDMCCDTSRTTHGHTPCTHNQWLYT